MAPRKKGKEKNITDESSLSESERMLLQQKVHQFMSSEEDERELPGLSTEHRKYIHKYALRFAIKSHSYNIGKDRVLFLRKRKPKAAMGDLRELRLKESTRRMLIDMQPTLMAQMSTDEASTRKTFQHNHARQKRLRGEALQLSLGPSMVPPPANRISGDLYRDKQELPIFRYQDELLSMLNQYSIFIVNGETGSGKTTQVPQYILNDATRNNRACRVVVSQPRRVGAVSVSCRVAEERGEQLGGTVGYQIRMESRLRKNTNLIYTTSGCLLRSIMADSQEFFRKVSHLIIDEIHERDKYTDFALITIKEQLQKNTNLKVILMSATMDIELLSSYFSGCPILNVPGQGYEVKIYHLEDILYHTGYRTALMEKYLRSMNEMPQQQQLNYNKALAVPTATTSAASGATPTVGNDASVMDENIQSSLNAMLDQFELECTRSEEELSEMFDQLQYYIESEGMPVNATHSETGMTPLIAACKYNCPEYVQSFLERQADPELRDVHGCSAVDYAAQWCDGVCMRVLQSGCGAVMQQKLQLDEEEMTKQTLLKAYQRQFNDDNDVDHDLILSLLEGLYRSVHPGAIMVFLPGYNDIVQQRDLIASTLPFGTYRICILHGQMDSRDQFEALQPMLVRKIVLSTNIGQTSITIPDLAYIIDSGKVKMNTYDTITESSQLQSVWISQADASQRAGRAGRTQNGICYRLFSSIKYQYMPTFCVPEFLRIPLTEICLYARTVAPQHNVQEFLALALNPPSTVSVQNAIRKLQILEVFTDDESVTDLGRHLVDIPLDVQLGKCLLYSIFFKCFDPVLTIVSFHSVKDPFLLPADRALQGQTSFQRKALAGDSYSDQMGILELYRGYSAIRSNRKRAQEYCAKYALSLSAMETFCATRRQILDLVAGKFRLGPQVTLFNHDWNMVRLCLAAGFYPNVAFVDREKSSLLSGAEKSLVLQRSSALNPPGKKNIKDFISELPHDWIIFYEKSRISNTCAINMNTVLAPFYIALQCGRDCKIELDNNDSDVSNEVSDDEESTNSKTALHKRLQNGNGGGAVNHIDALQNAFNLMNLDRKDKTLAIMALDNWIKFSVKAFDANLLLLLRQSLRTQFTLFMQRGHSPDMATAVYFVQKLLYTLEEIKGGSGSSGGGGSAALGAPVVEHKNHKAKAKSKLSTAALN